MKRIRNKMGLSYLVLVSIVIGSASIVAYNVSQLTDSVTRTLLGNVQSVLAAENMVKVLTQQQKSYVSYLTTGDTSALVLFRRERSEFIQWLQVARGSMVLPSEPTIVDSIARLFRVYSHVSDSIIALRQAGGLRERMLDLHDGLTAPVADRLSRNCQQLVSVNHDAIIEADRVVRETSAQSTLIVVATSVLAIVLSLLSAVQFNRSISKPAEVLTQTVRKISQGNLNQKIDITTDDEIGELGREFNKMTERLRMYEEMNINQLLAEKKKTEEIVANIPDAVIVTNARGELQVMNRAAEHLLGLQGMEWRGKHLDSIIPDPRWQELIDLEPEGARDPGKAETLLTIGQGSGAMYFRPRRRAIRDDKGIIQGYAILVQDVTRFKNLDQMKSEFLATVSHEFRTPLTSLNMSVDILSQGLLGPLNDHQRELLAAAKDDCERLKKFVTDLLDLSRLESGTYQIKIEPVDLRLVFDNAVKPLMLQFKEKAVKLVVAVEESARFLNADGRQLSWVVTNLVTNALRYSPAGESILLSASVHGEAVQIFVQDSGKGIPEEMRESIFEKFVQIREATDSTPGSVGLGLAIAKEIVEAHRGRIWVENAPKRGSRFVFTIPISQQLSPLVT